MRAMLLVGGLLSLIAGTGCVTGTEQDAVVLKNDALTVKFLPAYGGKIVSITDNSGFEYLSRSDRPYTERTFGMEYGKTEFDGVDECFPSLGSCKYPVAPWKDVQVVDHGELCQIAWQQTKGKGVALEAKGVNFPYVFKRQATLDGSTLVLDYTVTNTSKHPFYFSYAFHPLFRGLDGTKVVVPDDMPIVASWSTKRFLGKNGTIRKWAEMKDADGKPFKDDMFKIDRKRYYKFFSAPLTEGRGVIEHPDGRKITMTWPAKLFPRFAVWCSEGGVGTLHHIAIEPTNTIYDRLDKDYKNGVALEIPPEKSITWQIRISFTER